MKELLTRNECTAMRGIAILAIVLHNYCHFISKIVQENEYQFFVSHNEQLWQVVTNPDALLPVHLLSFFGHYGVPVFLFLSGYGLFAIVLRALWRACLPVSERLWTRQEIRDLRQFLSSCEICAL